MTKKKVVVAMSGGLDSTVLVATLINAGYSVLGVTFKYGSKHNPKELKAASNVIKFYRAKYSPEEFSMYSDDPINLTSVFYGIDSPFFANNKKRIPTGEYSEDNMHDTVVPARNVIFISILASIAERTSCEYIAIGVHANDSEIYKDCRKEFIEAMRIAVEKGTDHSVKLLAPYVNLEKKSIVHDGKTLKVPFELTRSCYESGDEACGKCATCVDRLKAFYDNDMVDPVAYENVDAQLGIVKDSLNSKYIESIVKYSQFIKSNTPLYKNDKDSIKEFDNLFGKAIREYYVEPILNYTNQKIQLLKKEEMIREENNKILKEKKNKRKGICSILLDGVRFTQDTNILKPYQYYEVVNMYDSINFIGMYFPEYEGFVIIKGISNPITRIVKSNHSYIFWRRITTNE